MTTSAAPTDPAERLALLIDREEIRALVHEFARSIDAKDQPAYAATFSKDAELVLPFGTFRGRVAIAAMHGPPPHVATHHHLGQIVIEVTGDTATARSSLIATHAFDAADRTQKAHSGGWYEQELVRTAEGWRFSRARLVIVWEDARPMIEPPAAGQRPS